MLSLQGVSAFTVPDTGHATGNEPDAGGMPAGTYGGAEQHLRGAPRLDIQSSIVAMPR